MRGIALGEFNPLSSWSQIHGMAWFYDMKRPTKKNRGCIYAGQRGDAIDTVTMFMLACNMVKKPTEIQALTHKCQPGQVPQNFDNSNQNGRD